MTKLTLSLIDDNDKIIKKESQMIESTESKEFIKALVLLCSKMDIGVPFWTPFEEKALSKCNEIIINDEEYEDKSLKISIEAV